MVVAASSRFPAVGVVGDIPTSLEVALAPMCRLNRGRGQLLTSVVYKLSGAAAVEALLECARRWLRPQEAGVVIGNVVVAAVLPDGLGGASPDGVMGMRGIWTGSECGSQPRGQRILGALGRSVLERPVG
jgi:hypothetical protein